MNEKQDIIFKVEEVYKISQAEDDSETIFQEYGTYSFKHRTLHHSKLSLWERRSNLRGFKFKIAILDSIPNQKLFRNEDNTYHMTGIYADVFHNLQSILNFTYEFNQPLDGNWGVQKDDNKSWTGMIGQLINKEIDLVPASFTVTHLRSSVVDFAIPIVSIHHRFIIKYPDFTCNITAYLDPLTNKTWLVLVVIIIASTIIMQLVIRYRRDPKEQEFTKWKIFLFVSSAMTFAKPWHVTPVYTTNRIVFFTIILSGSLVFWHWEAMIISFLAVQIPNLPFNNIEDLMKNTNLRIALMPNSAFEDSFRHAKKGTVWHDAWLKRVKPTLHLLPKTRQELRNLIISDSDYVLYDTYLSLLTSPEYLECKITDVKTPYESKE